MLDGTKRNRKSAYFKELFLVKFTVQYTWSLEGLPFMKMLAFW